MDLDSSIHGQCNSLFLFLFFFCFWDDRSNFQSWSSNQKNPVLSDYSHKFAIQVLHFSVFLILENKSLNFFLLIFSKAPEQRDLSEVHRRFGSVLPMALAADRQSNYFAASNFSSNNNIDRSTNYNNDHDDSSPNNNYNDNDDDNTSSNDNNNYNNYDTRTNYNNNNNNDDTGTNNDIDDCTFTALHLRARSAMRSRRLHNSWWRRNNKSSTNSESLSNRRRSMLSNTDFRGDNRGPCCTNDSTVYGSSTDYSTPNNMHLCPKLSMRLQWLYNHIRSG